MEALLRGVLLGLGVPLMGVFLLLPLEGLFSDVSRVTDPRVFAVDLVGVLGGSASVLGGSASVLGGNASFLGMGASALGMGASVLGRRTSFFNSLMLIVSIFSTLVCLVLSREIVLLLPLDSLDLRPL